MLPIRGRMHALVRLRLFSLEQVRVPQITKPTYLFRNASHANSKSVPPTKTYSRRSRWPQNTYHRRSTQSSAKRCILRILSGMGERMLLALRRLQRRRLGLLQHLRQSRTMLYPRPSSSSLQTQRLLRSSSSIGSHTTDTTLSIYPLWSRRD